MTVVEVQALKDRPFSHAALYSKIISYDQALGAKYDLESRLWKNAIYPAIDVLRQQSRNCLVLEKSVIEQWNSFLTEAIQVHEDIIQALERQSSKVKEPVPAWHRAVNHAGDLERYRQLYLQQKEEDRDWTATKARYKLSILLAPNNGLYYHQLAIIYVHEGHHLEALYSYLRSLTVKSPFVNSRDAMKLLFRSAAKNKSTKPDRQRFEQLFVKLQEMVFTKISLDQFIDIQAHFLRVFSSLVLKKGLPEYEWLQLAAINIANVSLLGAKEGTEVGFAEGVSLTLRVMEALLKGCLELVHGEDASEVQGDDVTGLVYVQIVCAWLTAMEEDVEALLGDKKLVSFWSSFVNLCNTLSKQYPEILSMTNMESFLLSDILPEDWHLRGFTPLKSIYGKLHFGKTQSSTSGLRSAVDGVLEVERQWVERAADAENEWRKRRLRRILFFAKMLAEKMSFLRYDSETGTFAYLKASVDEVDASLKALANLDEEEELEYEPYDFETKRSAIVDVIDVEGTDGDVADLMFRRQELHGSLSARQRTVVEGPQRARTVPSSAIKFKEGVTVLVFDTNFWLGKFEDVKKVVESGKWVVSVPLVVIAELDGLKKTTDPTRAAEAKTASSYLEAEFSANLDSRKRKKWLKLQTSQGNFLGSLMVRTENWNEGGGRMSNDDVVLKCCRILQKGKEGGWSEVVLFTDDRNLRLKARVEGVDVSGKIGDLGMV
ncbi:hypothetical protein HK097_003259 [Rhizophlyctis rosea]|uniref:PIN domain-containing protein n=1 Tax=Rhizophlyctis rosea TaxID=64517 RepID=A0AAD5SGQ0_9FUNG|nr:hypothetical protein HK097_003259 [Rhizophlyctis rosea]